MSDARAETSHDIGAGSRRRLARRLFLAFAFAMVMGPGPGIYLVNPDPSNPESVVTVGNVPVIYLWALFWLGVQVSILLVAYFRLWNSE